MKDTNTIITSAIRPDGTLVEMLYQPKEQSTSFAIFRDGVVELAGKLDIKDEPSLIPMPPNSDLVKNHVILFPSVPSDYGTDQELIQKIREFIHAYLQVGPLFEQIACYYVLLTWVYERFNELPYLRAIGDYGTGKSRFLKVVGSLCYKPIFANGAITASPIFRILEATHGTIVMNEADFAQTDAWSEITKILNNGFETDFCVLRSEPTKGKSYEVKSFNVFGPKILGARNHFEDKALESRLITEEMDNVDLRHDIPINLPEKFRDEALALRNQLLMWRFKNYYNVRPNAALIDRSIEPRLNQILVPLCSIITDQNLISDIKNLVKQMNNQIVKDRGMSREAELVEAIFQLQAELVLEPTVKVICDKFNDGRAEREQLQSRKVGSLLRQKLGLLLERGGEGYVLQYTTNQEKLEKLRSKYGLTDLSPDNAGEVKDKLTS